MSDYSRAEIIEAFCRMTTWTNHDEYARLAYGLGMFLEKRGPAPTAAEIDAAIAWIRRWNDDEGMDALILRRLDKLAEQLAFLANPKSGGDQ